MTARKRSHSPPVEATPVDSTDPATSPAHKRPRSDIDIIRARTASAKISATPSEGAGPDEPEPPGVPGTEESSPLTFKGDEAGGKGRGVYARSAMGKKGRGRGRRGDRPDRRSLGWAAPAKDDTATATAPGEEEHGAEGRRPKRKVAVVIGYVGTGYNGSQIQVADTADPENIKIDPFGIKTIEGDLFKALVQAGCISEDNSKNPLKVHLSRCARTDANVHAACNLISLKLILDPPSLDAATPTATSATSSTEPHYSDALVTHLNRFLPPHIRIWGFYRVMGSFQPRPMCESRTYEYSVPTYVFLPPKPGSVMHERLNECAGWATGEEPGAGGDVGEEATWWQGKPLDGSFQDDLRKKRAFRISQAMLGRVRAAFAEFEGVHNFHNYTLGKEFRDRSATRIMKELTVSEPFLVEGTEWVSLTFHGQSFMMHQIRNMMAMVILLCRTRTPSQLIPETFGPQRIRIPKAPGLGLLLVRPHFPGYNKMVDRHNEQQKNEPRETLDFDRWNEGIEEFRRERIYKRMREDEKGENSFAMWVNYTEVFNGPSLDYLNPKGIILHSAVASPKSPPKPKKDEPKPEAEGEDGGTELFGEEEEAEKEVKAKGKQDEEDEG